MLHLLKGQELHKAANFFPHTKYGEKIEGEGKSRWQKIDKLN